MSNMKHILNSIAATCKISHPALTKLTSMLTPVSMAKKSLLISQLKKIQMSTLSRRE